MDKLDQELDEMADKMLNGRKAKIANKISSSKFFGNFLRAMVYVLAGSIPLLVGILKIPLVAPADPPEHKIKNEKHPPSIFVVFSDRDSYIAGSNIIDASDEPNWKLTLPAEKCGLSDARNKYVYMVNAELEKKFMFFPEMSYQRIMSADSSILDGEVAYYLLMNCQDPTVAIVEKRNKQAFPDY